MGFYELNGDIQKALINQTSHSDKADQVRLNISIPAASMVRYSIMWDGGLHRRYYDGEI